MSDPIERQLREIVRSLQSLDKTLTMTNTLLYELVRPKPKDDIDA